GVEAADPGRTGRAQLLLVEPVEVLVVVGTDDAERGERLDGGPVAGGGCCDAEGQGERRRERAGDGAQPRGASHDRQGSTLVARRPTWVRLVGPVVHELSALPVPAAPSPRVGRDAIRGVLDA